jgi:hypothetical protein
MELIMRRRDKKARDENFLTGALEVNMSVDHYFGEQHFEDSERDMDELFEDDQMEIFELKDWLSEDRTYEF